MLVTPKEEYNENKRAMTLRKVKPRPPDLEDITDLVFLMFGRSQLLFNIEANYKSLRVSYLAPQ